MLSKQKEEQGNALVTTILFDDGYEILHDRQDIKNIKNLGNKDYIIGGSTALLDAFGKTIKKIKKAQKAMPKEERPEKSIFIVITDGDENSSRKYTYKDVEILINSSKKKSNYEYIFLGANIDAIAEASKLGIHESHACNYHADEEGTALNFEVLSDAICMCRSSIEIDENWKESIEEDFKKRGK